VGAGRRGKPASPASTLDIVGSAQRACQPASQPACLASACLPAWLFDQYCHGYDVQRGGERRVGGVGGGWLAGWLDGWLAGRPAGWLAGWLAG